MRMLGYSLGLAAMAVAAAPASFAGEFVTVSGRQFVLDGRPWYACGANLWYGANLGRPSNPLGRARLVRELDRLQKLGINQLRVLGASEQCAVPRTLRPAITLSPGVYDEDMLQGLDFLIGESGKRRLRLVIFLNNYWDWSGGMPQYLAWATGRPARGLGSLPWREWNRVQATFYTNKAGQEMARRYMAMLVDRTNTLTGLKYRDDPAIMAWELANEPRPGEGDDNKAVFMEFLRWVESVSAYLHSLDSHHLVTTGSEGLRGCLESVDYFRQVHAVKTIDYAVIHVWPNNWGWFKRDRFQETIGATLENARAYILPHIAVTDSLNKPLVIEEFGLDRDGGLATDKGVGSRDRFYSEVFRLIENSAASGGSAAGSDFWLWGGEGRPSSPGAGPPADGIGAGDMLQEPSGLNTVFDCDQSTLAIVARHYSNLQALGRGR